MFEATAFKEKELAEKVVKLLKKKKMHFSLLFLKYKFLNLTFHKVGWQTQTTARNPRDLSIRRAVLGPSCYLTADGTVDNDPIHYW